MKSVKCEACGAPLAVKEPLGRCPYCGMVYTNETKLDFVATEEQKSVAKEPKKKPEHEPVKLNKTEIEKVSELSESDRKLFYSPRPKVKVIPTVFGLCFGILPGIFYILYKVGLQEQWDQLHKTI